MIELTGTSSPIERLPLPADDPVRRRPDISLAKEVLGWEPTVQLREGLLHTIDYFRAQKAQSSLQHWQHVTDTVNHRIDSRPASRARRLLGD